MTTAEFSKVIGNELGATTNESFFLPQTETLSRRLESAQRLQFVEAGGLEKKFSCLF